MFIIYRLSKCLQGTFTQNPEKLPNPSKCPSKNKPPESKGCPGCCLCAEWPLSKARRPACSRQVSVFVVFVRFSQWGPSFRLNTIIFHDSHTSENCICQKALGHSGGSCLEFKKQKKRHVKCSEKTRGEECYELCSEQFSSTVLIGPIFRLQYLAESIMQFIFPQADTNDLTQSQFIFMELN